MNQSKNQTIRTFCILACILISLFAGCSKKNSTGPEPVLTVTDIDGNVYPVVQIGDQYWMAENLKVTHYRNGDPIPEVSDSTVWQQTVTGALCHYANDAANSATYGCLYNWYVVDDARGIAPRGWHVPSDDEWIELERQLGMDQSELDNIGWRGDDVGGMLKEAGTAHWDGPNAGATNESGFSALPAGLRSIGQLRYVGLGNAVEYWSTTEDGNVTGRELSAFISGIGRGPKSKKNGLSIRCVMDN